jgi:AGZA family xanthine/uracil permease-like MFS transporter
MWIGIMCGGVLTAYLMSFKVKSAIIIGIAVVSIMSWPYAILSPKLDILTNPSSRDTPFTYFPYTESGNSQFAFFQKVVAFQPIRNLLAANDWNLTHAGRHFALALFTFLYVDIIDASATLYSMARFSGVVDPSTGDFPRSTLAYCCDAVTISIGSLLGVSPSTAFIESGAGITEGGRTGLTAMTTGVCFLISLFVAPIFASIPPWATGCTLIIVGCLMMRQVTNVNWTYWGDALPAFVTIATMPLSYSVAYGLIAGLFTYTVLNGLIWITDRASGGRWQPPDFDNKEYWTAMPKGGTLPWFVRFTQGRSWKFGRGNDEAESVACNTEASERELVEAKMGGLRRNESQ